LSSRWRLVRASDDAVPASVRRFSERARRRRLRAARPWLVGLGVLGALGVAAAVVYATPLLGVAEVRVSGARLVSVEEVRSAARVAPGTPLARVDPGAVGRRVGGLPPVYRAKVTRKWPRTLVVTVVERTPVAAVPVGDRYAIVDREGVVFDSAAQRPAALPVLKLGTPGPDDPATRAALTVLAALPPALRDRMTALVADAPARIRLELTDGRQVVWGDATQNDIKASVALFLLERDQRVVDVSAPSVVPMR
jgi:cell division protein FtsQ